ncbi:hypothetical protein [Nocardia terpenica]|uniref:Uncharacterized protein n=1 Tax=Nocardia terpenica TaxID=455432 RepID=A0A6G9YYM1_9NOCA|nr:hypothetical protein [Nocardia terpenica]QIS18270.1 hypothetical protein F6W96_08240 [Nocardia terpenica]
MRVNTVGVAAALAAIVSAGLVASSGTAAADEGTAWASVTGGRERVQFFVHASAQCKTKYLATINGAVVAQDEFYQRFGGLKTVPAPVGSPWVKVVVYCDSPGDVDTLNVTVFDGPVAVGPANPALDALDDALAGAGSSQLRTDPTRP